MRSQNSKDWHFSRRSRRTIAAMCFYICSQTLKDTSVFRHICNGFAIARETGAIGE
ncbi:hypothetical protein I8748_34515 [Nostoc sp. CENA67]|uniref:Uncharacterized protein n=1 Tax=Amazonocrinis nigriterrae CENA67 TaxID=2794033 RepID=A0A8J7HWI2_9NOST|nr:hypothetical protein [Amazonocrinis nigriterrae CENA67]